ncbi:MAG: PilZ domain-containing protein [Sutterellaceae bacterium]|nr:PilZ domain-containing protein [Burkholderiaceae bacterium]MCX7901935.1 PilZ domain-containing protein [Burkholderiaceae bacterium]MDW8431040.1 PilZ domain-containing protein [Sutterellaceae bacterium]
MNDLSPNTRLASNTPNPPAAAGSAPGAASGSSRPSVLSLTIKEKAALYAAYMPFLKNGGIFVPTSRQYQLGDEVYLILTLMDDPTKIPVAGKVVWISPPGGGVRQPGIGVHFPADETGVAARKRIEDILGTALKSSRPTHTL